MGTRAMLMPRLRATRSIVSRFFSVVPRECASARAKGRVCGNRAFMKA